MVNAGHKRQPEPSDAEHPVAESLVVVHHVELRPARGQRAPHPQAEGERLGEGAAPHHGGLQDVGPVPVLAQARRAKRVDVAVQIQAGQLAQEGAGIQFGIRRPGEHLDVVPERV
jgi:hypothetical protein